MIAPPLPQYIAAENAIIGAILIHKGVPNAPLERARAIVSAGDFFDRRHQTIFAAVLAMAEADIAVDLLTVIDWLKCKGKLEAAGGDAYVSELISGAYSVINIEHYAKIVLEKARLRQLIDTCEAAKQSAFQAQEDADTIRERVTLALSSLSVNGTGAGRPFDTFQEFESTPEATFSIKGFLQNYCVNAIAGLSDHGKTWLSLNIAQALLFGPGLLWDLFEVSTRAEKIIYLIPEASRATFKTRLQLMNLYDEIDKRLFVRTLTKGPTLQLTDRGILSAAQDAYVFCDTAIRFMRAIDENSASEAAQNLSEDFFALQRAGARGIIALFHSPKSFLTQRVMTLENMIRGTSEFGAVLASAWGVRQTEKDTNTVHIENLKDRDFHSCGPFQLMGRPYIDQEGSFRMHRRPGDCGPLHECLEDDGHSRGGAPAESREERARRIRIIKDILAKDRKQTVEQLRDQLDKDYAIKVSTSAVKNYRRDAL